MIIRKASASNGDGLTFVLSDATTDRLGDTIEPKGWQLQQFRENPIALFGHNSSFPIGTWTDIHVKGDKLLGTLKLAAKGTSQRIDELISLVEQKVLRAVSVGFKPLEQEPLEAKDPFGPQRFKKQELLEVSLVSVPANPAALSLAKSLHLSDETMSLAFGEQAVTRDMQTATGKQAVTPQSKAKPKMKSLAERVQDAQTKLNELRDQLTAHIEKAGDEADEAAMAITDELNGKLAIAQRSLEQLQAAERQLATHTAQVASTTVPEVRRPLGVTSPKLKPGELIFRSLTAMLVGHAQGKRPAEHVLAERYGSDGKVDDQTRAIFNIVCRSVTAPAVADPAVPTWAGVLMETQYAEFMSLLIPQSVYPGLSARGLRLSFGRSGIISIPKRDATPTIAGAFVLQGDPIPVKQGSFSAVTLGPKKMAVISAFTREIAEHSTPAIEGLIRDAMQEDTSVALDTVLLDATAASATRPAGIRNGVSVTTATAGGGFAALVGDIKALVGALITATNGNLRNPVWIMNPVQAISIALTQNAGGEFPFAAEINGNRLQGYPVIVSSTVTAGMVILIDAGDFVSVEGDAPRFQVSDTATLHMETVPLPISATGSPNTVAAPIRSLFQTDTLALRMIMDVNWAIRRTPAPLAWTQAVTW